MRKLIKAVDLFAGVGGTSSGLYDAVEETGRKLKLTAINHWPLAIENHKANHPDAEHICARIESLSPRRVVPEGKLNILVASPECIFHSNARGSMPINDQLRASAWCIPDWISSLNVESWAIENVKEFRFWGPVNSRGRKIKSREGETYQAYLAALRSLGYTVEDRVLNCADYGDATSRERLFIIGRRGSKKIKWPTPTHIDAGESGVLFEDLQPWRAAREIIDFSFGLGNGRRLISA